ncbi:MAG: 16S rRNA (cytidine(1402)-2'-O)-methyltransferase [Proteobacteria bacterium]|nr:16S rRNA (cytidine(1402)-2'-O)-methyltransferase [Pseudomonadota bacterium]
MGKNVHQRRDKKRKASIREAGPPAGEQPETRKSSGGKEGTLYVVATPIGNLDDITIRAIRVLKEVRLIAAEDTRRTRILLNAYQILTPLTSLYDQNEARKCGLLLARLQGGEDVAYVSDAGTPGISDPGYILVREAILRGIRVAPVPGASALIAALSVSGLPMDSFVFHGFLPSKSTRRRQLLTSLLKEERTLIFYESPRRLLSSLHDIEELLGGREVVVSREMTKIYEEFLRGPVSEVITGLGDGTVRGEVTLIVAGRTGETPDCSDEELLRRHEQLRQEGGLSLRDMADRLAQETGVSRRRIYRLLLFP